MEYVTQAPKMMSSVLAQANEITELASTNGEVIITEKYSV